MGVIGLIQNEYFLLLYYQHVNKDNIS
jgi:hypothetical protein